MVKNMYIFPEHKKRKKIYLPKTFIFDMNPYRNKNPDPNIMTLKLLIQVVNEPKYPH